MRRYVALAAWVLLWPLASSAAEEGVSEVRFQAVGHTVHVFYTLTGKGLYEVSLRLSADGGQTFSAVPKTLSGAVGDGVEPGPNKRIIWDALQDVPRLEGNRFRFQVRASRPKGGSGKVLLGLIGAGAVGGAAAYALQPKEGDIQVNVPDPEDNATP